MTPIVSDPVLSIVLVCWNSRKDLGPCLAALCGANLENPFEVIVVDNASTDGSPEFVKDAFPQVRLIENRENAGFAAACNTGVKASRGRYVLLLNNDTLPQGRSIDRLVRFMAEKDSAGAVGGRLLNADGSFQAGFARFSTLFEELLISLQVGDRLWAGFPSHRDADTVTSADWLSAACLLVRRAAYLDAGGMDESYFMYSEEVDLQFRLKAAGWEIFYLPDVQTIHLGGRSQNRWQRRKMVYRGKILFYRKNYSRLKEMLLRGMLAIVTAGKLVVWVSARAMRPSSERAGLEVRSNLDVLRICLAPQ